MIGPVIAGVAVVVGLIAAGAGAARAKGEPRRELPRRRGAEEPRRDEPGRRKPIGKIERVYFAGETFGKPQVGPELYGGGNIAKQWSRKYAGGKPVVLVDDAKGTGQDTWGIADASGKAIARFFYVWSEKPKAKKPAGTKPTKRADDPKKKATPKARAFDVMSIVAAAWATQDPKKMRAAADKCDDNGYHQAADDLRDEAERLEAGHRTTPKPIKQPVKKAEPKPTPKPAPKRAKDLPKRDEPKRDEPDEPDEPTPPPEDPQRVRAREMTDNLKAVGGIAGRYKYSKPLVAAFQKGEGLTDDGIYGWRTAVIVLEKYGIVPSVPLFWSKATWQADKAEFKRRVNLYASSDPARASEYEKLLADTLRS